VLPAVQEVKALGSEAHCYGAGQPAVWAREVWKEQNLSFNQLLLRAVAVGSLSLYALKKNKCFGGWFSPKMSSLLWFL